MVRDKALINGHHTFAIEVNGIERRYTVYVPWGYDGITSMPVVMMLHGGSSTAEQYMRKTDWVNKANEEGFLVAYPNATRPDMSSPPTGLVMKDGFPAPETPIKGRPETGNPQTWNDEGNYAQAVVPDIDDIAFLSALIDDMVSRFAVDEKRVYCAGISNGGHMTLRVGVELSERIAAIAPVTGQLFIKEPRMKRPVSLMYIIGTEDPFNSLEGGYPKLWMSSGEQYTKLAGGDMWRPPVTVTIDNWVKIIGASPEPEVIVDSGGVKGLAYRNGKGGSEVHFYIVEGMGHIWPGTQLMDYEEWLGPCSDKLKAEDVMWEFFSRFSLP